LKYEKTKKGKKITVRYVPKKKSYGEMLKNIKTWGDWIWSNGTINKCD
jgi:hypothetical protein